MPDQLIGCELPRVYTPPLDPDPDTGLPRLTLGPEIEAYAGLLGISLMPWQRQAIYRMTELLPNGQLRFRTVVLEVARQNGKSAVLTLLSGYFAMVRGDAVLACAQDLSTAVDLWRTGIREIEASPLVTELATVRYASGQQSAEMRNGGTWRVVAATPSAGRGKRRIGLLTLDEARHLETPEALAALSPTQATHPDPMMILASNAGERRSVVLAAQRRLALDSLNDPSTRIGLWSWSAAPGARLDDREAWAQANPALSHTIHPDYLAEKIRTLPEGTVRIEHLCQWVQTEARAIPTASWAACSDSTALVDPSAPMHWSLDVSLDGRATTLVAAQRDKATDRVTVQVLRTWDGSDSAARAGMEMPALIEQHRPLTLGWQSSSSAAVLTHALRRTKSTRTKLREIRGVDVAAICSRLVERVESHRIRHAAEPLLDRQIESAQGVPRGDLIVFRRAHGGASVEAVYALAIAVDLASAETEPAKLQMIRPRQS